MPTSELIAAYIEACEAGDKGAALVFACRLSNRGVDAEAARNRGENR